MRIHEAAKAVGCTQRAIKFYEDKGLLPAVSRSGNGYRDYSDADIKMLHAIHAYRKLGIGISDIKRLLHSKDRTLLKEILEQKRADAAAKQAEIRALEDYIASGDVKLLNETLDYACIAEAMQSQLPGLFGVCLSHHFAPYLNIQIHTTEQQDAYARILAYWDNPALRLPLLYRISMLIQHFMPPTSAAQMDASIKSMFCPTEEAYAKMKTQVIATVRLRKNPLVKYSPGEIMKRQMMKRMKDCGYYDIFLPQMERLSPAYKAYRDALKALDQRLCDDLGLHYDSDYNLILKE